MRSVSRYGDRSRDRSRGDKTSEKRSESKDSKKEYKNCIGCKCEECVKMRKNAKELNVQLCDGFQSERGNKDVEYKELEEKGGNKRRRERKQEKLRIIICRRVRLKLRGRCSTDQEGK